MVEKQMDSLEINNLQVNATIGVHAWEQQIRQKLTLDIQVGVILGDLNDELDKALDYAHLCEQVTQFIENNAFQLIETVAEKTIDLIQTEFNVKQVKVRVCKPHAIAHANVCVTMSKM